MSTRIYVMTHKPFCPPDDPIYIPLHVGRAGKADIGYQGDDTGEHISDLNCYYGELTGLYWLWQNLDFDGNIGICHYRRYFVDENGELLHEADYDRILSEYDMITSCKMGTPKPYRDYYAEAHNLLDLEQEGEVIRDIFPEDYPAFEQVMGGKENYFGNLMAAPKKQLDAYCEWLFTIFAELGTRIDLNRYADAYHRRVFGFLSEQLLLVWVTARGLRTYGCPICITDEKAETQELKLAVGQLLKERRVGEARQLFYEILKVRPDIRLEHSDLRSEVPLIELILYICECEETCGIEGMLDYSLNLWDLIVHIRKVREIRRKGDNLEQEERDYLRDTGVSELMLEVLARNDR